MQKVNIHDEVDKKVKNDNITILMQIHVHESFLLQNNSQLYLHVHQYIRFKDSGKSRLFKTNL